MIFYKLHYTLDKCIHLRVISHNSVSHDFKA
jgi:hypothetical protein